MTKKRESATSRAQSQACAHMDKFLTSEINRKRKIDIEEETRRGALLAEVLNLTPIHYPEIERGRYRTTWGTKTARGLFAIAKRIIEEGA